MRTALFWVTCCVVAQKSAVLVKNIFTGRKRKFRLREEERKLRLKFSQNLRRTGKFSTERNGILCQQNS
jgi:hypothetical protein